MNILEKAYRQLYSENEEVYLFEVNYSGKFSSYNANIRLRNKYKLTINMSRSWQDVHEDIQIGLIQHLLNKIFKTKKKTIEMDLYQTFLKRVHVTIAKDDIDPYLKESFNRVNDEYFEGLMETSNLVFGENSMRKLGSYEYGTDTISMSTVLRDAPHELLDLVMYHEMLHKKHKFKNSSQRTLHHSPIFKKDEAKFKDYELREDQLKNFLRKKRFKRFFGF